MAETLSAEAEILSLVREALSLLAETLSPEAGTLSVVAEMLSADADYYLSLSYAVRTSCDEPVTRKKQGVHHNKNNHFDEEFRCLVAVGL